MTRLRALAVSLALVLTLALASIVSASPAPSHAAPAAPPTTPCVNSRTQVMTPHGPGIAFHICIPAPAPAHTKAGIRPATTAYCGGFTSDWQVGTALRMYGYASCSVSEPINTEMGGVMCAREVGSGCSGWVMSWRPYPDPYCDDIGFNIWCPASGSFQWDPVPAGHRVNSEFTVCAVMYGNYTCIDVEGNWIDF